MIVMGDISGIQGFLLDVAETGGGQARRLRARSFFIQTIAEAAALRVLRTLGWPLGDIHLLTSAAGHFLLRGAAPADAQISLQRLQAEMNDWLLDHCGGHLRLTLAWSDASADDVACYTAARTGLEQEKLRPWAESAVSAAGWEPARLVLRPLDTPCALCRRRPAEVPEIDRETGVERRVCSQCDEFRRLGERLPNARWLVFATPPADDGLEALGLCIRTSAAETASVADSTVAVANLRDPDMPPPGCPTKLHLKRRFSAHVPAGRRGPLTFTEIARTSRGAPLLGVLKADADSLGLAIERLLSDGEGLDGYVAFSQRLDRFFAGRLQAELRGDRRWGSIYTVFAGGDDLLLVGPWDTMIDFAGRVRELFSQEFSADGLTISAGLALIKPKRPIKHAVAQAEALMHQAKSDLAPGAPQPKDQMAALGQIWKWENHMKIVAAGRQLADWVDGRIAQRAWLFTLLELAEARANDGPDPKPAAAGLASARLAYHIARNYPRPNDRDERRRKLRAWADAIAADFEQGRNPLTVYLPAVVRYALTATRTADLEDF